MRGQYGPLKAAAYAIIMLAAGPALADEAVTYHRFGSDTYGSDGSREHEFARDRYIKDRDGHQTRCHEFAGNNIAKSDYGRIVN